jgi:hypothetical protein
VNQMNAQLLVRACGAHERLGVAAQMQAHARPVADGKHRHVDLVPLRLRAAECAAVEIIVQPEMQRVDLPAVGDVLRGTTEQMMQHVRRVPIGHEQAQDAAMIEGVAVKVGEALPGNNGFQGRRP